MRRWLYREGSWHHCLCTFPGLKFLQPESLHCAIKLSDLWPCVMWPASPVCLLPRYSRALGRNQATQNIWGQSLPSLRIKRLVDIKPQAVFTALYNSPPRYQQAAPDRAARSCTFPSLLLLFNFSSLSPSLSWVIGWSVMYLLRHLWVALDKTLPWPSEMLVRAISVRPDTASAAPHNCHRA